MANSFIDPLLILVHSVVGREKSRTSKWVLGGCQSKGNNTPVSELCLREASCRRLAYRCRRRVGPSRPPPRCGKSSPSGPTPGGVRALVTVQGWDGLHTISINIGERPTNDIICYICLKAKIIQSPIELMLTHFDVVTSAILFSSCRRTLALKN